MKKILENKKIRYALIFIVAVIVCIGITYAYWMLTKEQTGENLVNSACLRKCLSIKTRTIRKFFKYSNPISFYNKK